jgi:hydrophobe/amphiphile efflux-1 (HAE1) family protein
VNLSGVAIKRPVFTTMMMAAVFVLGIMGFSRLGTDLFPDVSFPVVVVTVPYPGASPTEVENLISRPVEDAVIGLNGIDRVRSFSREGASQTWVMFKLGVDLDSAATEVRERISQIEYKLPQDAKDPTVGRFDVSAAPILSYTLQTAGSLSEARKFADDVLKPELEQVSGVAAVNVQGGGVREIQVELDRAKLDALGLSAGVVAQRLQAENINVPAGRFDEGAREISVRTVGEFPNVEAIRDVIVATSATGASVRLRDVAAVVDGFEEQRTLSRVNGQEAVTFDVVKRSGTNTVAVADAVSARLKSLEARFPKGMKYDLIIDQPRFIRDSVDQVKHDLVFGGAMAVLVILFFMLDLRSTLISATALPTSVIGTFFIIYVFGYTLNMMTLLALSLSIGLLIDDAVVVRENIFKHLERGRSPMAAAIEGTKEIALVVLATTATVVAVFLPVAFVPGMVGQFFRQFGNTVIAAVVLSMFVAFTLDPMLSSRFSKALHDERDRFAGVKRPFRWFFAHMDDTYRTILGWSLRHKLVVGVLAIGSFVFMIFLAGLTGNDFVNSEDRGQFVVEVELPPGSSLAETSRASARAEEELRKNPEVTVLFSTVGPLGEINKARWRVVTTPKMERTVTLEGLKNAAREAVARTLPQAKVVVTDPPFVEGAAAEAPIMINVRGETYEDILPLARNIEGILRTTAGVQDINVKYSPGRPELKVSIDRERAAERGLMVAPLALSLRAAMEGAEAGQLRQGQDEVPIRVRLGKGDRDRPEDLAGLVLPTPKGPVRLGDVARFSRGEGPQVIERENRSRQIQIWASPSKRSLGDIVKDIQPQLAALTRPAGASIDYDGQIRLMSENNEAMGTALLLGALFIFIILASQFESFIHPVTIMLTLPLAMVGAVMGLFLSGNTMAMGSLIGIIFLMGLVTKNAILLIDRAIVRVRDHGEAPLHAMLEAGPERLRPILMTSAAMILGMLPTAVGSGEGSEFRAPMAIAVIGGVISSTFLSLVVVPVFYLAIENAKGRLARRFRRPARPAAPLPTPASVDAAE